MKKAILIVPVMVGLLGAVSTTVLAASREYIQGYNAGETEWNQFNSVGHSFECPLAKTAPHSDFCKGYDAALMFETSDQ